MYPSSYALALWLMLPLAAVADPNKFDWPQWRGPNRDGVSLESGLLKKWPKDGPPIAWKADNLGGGYGGGRKIGDIMLAQGACLTHRNLCLIRV